MKHKTKQRAVSFTDEDWKLIVSSAKIQGYTTTSSYIREVVIRKAKKDIKK